MINRIASIIIIIVFFSPLKVFSRDGGKVSFDNKDSTIEYYLAVPPGWTVEQFPLPPDFAPEINYHGAEDLRFAPGWADPKNEEHWSYCFLWWLDGKLKIDAELLQSNLTLYYTGLVGRNIVSRKIPKEKTVPTISTVRKIARANNDLETYSGTISMLDYITQEPMILNCSIHVKECRTPNKTAIFFEISPRPAVHPVWVKMKEIEESFACKK